MSLVQFIISALPTGGTTSYNNQLKNKIVPYLKQAFTQKKENDEAERWEDHPNN